MARLLLACGSLADRDVCGPGRDIFLPIASLFDRLYFFQINLETKSLKVHNLVREVIIIDEVSTKQLPIDRSLAEMILARLDAIESRFTSVETRLDSMDARLTKIEEQNERRAIETKPIWERALSEILEVKGEIAEIKEKVIETNERVRKIERQMTVLSKDVIEVRAEQFRLDNRIDKMESNPT